MNDATHNLPWPGDESGIRNLDEVCDRFEAAWQAAPPGRGPALEAFLPPPGVPARAAYFRELLPLDHHYRQMAGEVPTVAEYRARFPEFAELVGSLLAELGPESGDTFVQGAGSSTTEFRLAAVQVPGYEIEREIGRGAMGVVYLARQVALGRHVALKVIPFRGAMDEQELLQFRKETEAISRLNHPAIVHVHDGWQPGAEPSVPYLAMEYCPGGSLAAMLAGTPQPPRDAAATVEVLARAVHVAHEAGVIHRDLKPANVLLDADGRPKVSDFGLAKTLDADGDQTQTGALMGTPSYMAPEQAAGDAKHVGRAADVHALGAILYEMLTGRPPFKGTTVGETLDQVRHKDPVPPRQLQPKVGRDLETICLKCLQKEPGKRYASAAELADDLAAYREGRPIKARPVGAVEKAWRWAKRNRALAALYVVSVLALVAVAALGVWVWAERGWLDAEAARAEAALAREAAAQAQADAHKYLSLVSKARERMASPRPGWTWAALAELEEAATLPAAATQLPQLRSDAAECLGAIDVGPTKVIGEGLKVMSIAWSPDGRRIALGERALNIAIPWCSVTLVDLDAPEQIRKLPFLQTRVTRDKVYGPDLVTSLAFSPNGRWLVAGMRSGKLHRWDLKRDDPKVESWDGHEEDVRGLAFSGDGGELYSSGGKTIRRWSVETWAMKAVFTSEEEILELDVHPSEGWIVCGANHILCLDGVTLQPRRPRVDVQGWPVCFTRDGRCVAVARDGRIHVHDSRDWVLRHTWPSLEEGEQPGHIRTMIASPDGRLLLTAEAHGYARLRDMSNGKLMAEFPSQSPGKAAFAPDGRSFAVVAEDRTQLYEVGGLREQTRVALHSDMSVQAFALAPDGRSLITHGRLSAQDPAPELTAWPLPPTGPGAPVGRHRVADVIDHDPLRLAVSPVNGLMATGSLAPGASLRCWGPRDGRVVLGEKSAQCNHLQFDREGRLWAALSDEVRVWEVPAWRRLSGYVHRAGLGMMLTGKPNVYAVAPGRRWTAAACRDGSLAVLEFVPDKLRVHASPVVSRTPLRCVALSSDEELAAAGTEQGGVVVVRLPACKKLVELNAHQGGVVAVDWAANGVLATGGRDGLVRLWQWDGKELRELLSLRHPRPVRQVAWNAGSAELFILLENEGAVRVHHLDRLRDRLGKMGLGQGLDL